MRLLLLRKKIYKTFSLSSWPNSILRSIHYVVAYWDTSHKILMSTLLHTATLLLAGTGCCYWGSQATKLSTGAFCNGSDYQKPLQFPSALCHPPWLVEIWLLFTLEKFCIVQEGIHERYYGLLKKSLVSLINMLVFQLVWVLQIVWSTYNQAFLMVTSSWCSCHLATLCL